MNLFRANLVLGAAVLALAAPTVYVLQNERELFKDISRIPLLFDGFSADQVAAVVLAQPKPPAPPPPGTAPDQQPKVEYDQLQLLKADKGFVLGQGAGDLTGAPVNRELLESQVFKHLAEIRSDREALVQADASEEDLARYGLDEAHAFVVRAVNAQNLVLADLYVGNDASGGKYGTEFVRGLFVRRADSRDVVLYEVPYWQRQIKAEQWLDRVLLKAPADKVRRIGLRNLSTPERAIQFERPPGKTAWTCSEPPPGRGAVRQIEVEGLAQRFGYLAAQDFRMLLSRANAAALGLEPPAIEVSVTFEDDAGTERTVTLGIGGRVDDKSEHYLRSSSSLFLMTIASPYVAPFEREVSEFFDPQGPLPGASDPDKGDKDEDKDGDKGDRGR